MSGGFAGTLAFAIFEECQNKAAIPSRKTFKATEMVKVVFIFCRLIKFKIDGPGTQWFSLYQTLNFASLLKSKTGADFSSAPVMLSN